MYYMLLANLNKCLVGQQYSELCFITVNVYNLVNRSTVVLRKCTTCRFRCSQEFIVPGFNKHLKELHGKARECYLF